jgi:hypothetical protein
MLHARLLYMALVGLAACSCLSGCSSESGGGDKKDPFTAKCEKISIDGSQTLAAVETIMGAKGTEVPKEAFPHHDPKAVPFTKGKLVKENDNKFKAVADEKGTDAKVFRWEREGSKGRQAMFVVVLEDKVVNGAQVFLTNQ